MAFGDFKPYLNEIARSLRLISSAQCGAKSPSTTSAGTGNVPAGYNSVSITATTVPVTLTLSDASTYTFTLIGETIAQAAAEGGTLPAYTLSGGTWKWIGVKNN
jgi:hypothetical protein